MGRNDPRWRNWLLQDFLLRLFIKDHKNTGNTAVRAAYGKLAGAVGILGNILLFGAKLIVGTVSGSVSITADAVNNLSDASSSVVTLIGFRMASRPADEEHPYGHARIEYFSGLIVAAIILLIGVELGKTSVRKILHPEAVEFSVALVVVLVLSILVKLWMAWFYTRLGKKISSTTLIASGTDSRNDVISTAVVLLSCVVGHMTGLKIDGYMGLLVALFILWSGVGIAKETLDPLLGAAPDEGLVGAITEDLLAHPDVRSIHDLMIHDYGPGRQFASVHAEMDCRQDVLEAHEVLDELERECMARHNVLLTIHYDPIVSDDEALNAMRERVMAVIGEIDPRLSIHDFRMVCGNRNTNLIFDLVVPYDLAGKKGDIRRAIDEALDDGGDMTYRTVISFDDEAFNKNLK